MRLTILALSFAGLFVPGLALAQSTTAEVLRTTPGAHCTGDIVNSECTLTNPQYAAGNLAAQSGTEDNTMPTATGTMGTTGGSSGVLNPAPPASSLGTGGGSMGGGSSGGSSGGY